MIAHNDSTYTSRLTKYYDTHIIIYSRRYTEYTIALVFRINKYLFNVKKKPTFTETILAIREMVVSRYMPH